MPPTRYCRMAVSINRELTAYRALRHALDTMGQVKTGTAWHQDRVRQLAILIRSLTRRGVLN
jgi:hypothetical protein